MACKHSSIHNFNGRLVKGVVEYRNFWKYHVIHETSFVIDYQRDFEETYPTLTSALCELVAQHLLIGFSPSLSLTLFSCLPAPLCLSLIYSYFIWDAITYPCPNVGFVKPPLKFGMDAKLHGTFYMDVMSYPCPIYDAGLSNLAVMSTKIHSCLPNFSGYQDLWQHFADQMRSFKINGGISPNFMPLWMLIWMDISGNIKKVYSFTPVLYDKSARHKVFRERL